MRRLDRLVSLALLGSLTIALVPIASAHGFRASLEECREMETREERRECAKGIFKENDIKPPMRHGRRHKGMGKCLRMEDRTQASTCFMNIYDKVKKQRLQSDQ